MELKHKSSPIITIDYSENIIQISGRLIIINSDDFFIKLEKVLYVLEDYDLHIDIEYFNTFSFKMLYCMFYNIRIKNIHWFFGIDDEDTVMKGEFVKEILKSEKPEIGFVFIKK